MMVIKIALLLTAVLAGCNGLPMPEEPQDMSIYFERGDTSGRIVGGSLAPAGAHPWLAALFNGLNIRTFLCGGSIISRRTILTAAHCITPVRIGNTLASQFRANVGSNRWSAGGRLYAFQGFVIHPMWDDRNIKNDIGVLHTSTSIVLSNLVRIIALNYDWVGVGVGARVAGWGLNRAGGSVPANLMQLNVNTVDGNRCARDVPVVAAQNNLRNPPPVWPAMEICAFHSRNNGVCSGDSGSPLVRTNNNQQIGIVSWGLPCALGAPDMYARVSLYRVFIQTNTRN